MAPRRLLFAGQLPWFITLAVGVYLSASSPAFARTWYIKADGTGEAPTIQAGVDSAGAGDIVLVAPGTYASTVQVQVDGQPTSVNAYITKNISLRSESGAAVTKIDASGSDIGIVLAGVGATAEVSGFEVTVVPELIGCVLLKGAARASSALDRIAIRCDGSTCMIHDNFIHDADIGIRLNASSATISSNVFDNVAVGVDGHTSSDAMVMNNSATDFGEAFSFADSSPHIVGNKITNADGASYSCRGIACVSSGAASAYTPTISDNTITYLANEAIWCSGVTPTVSGNVLKGTWGAVFFFCPQVSFHDNVSIQNASGVELQYSTGSISENSLDGNGDGVLLFSSDASISGNIIHRGGNGIHCLGSSWTISCNDVFGANQPYSGCPNQSGLNGNFSADPQFCGIAESGNYYLQSDSPCVPGNHPDGADCGLIGARAANCGTVRTKTATWGQIKAMYRDK
jgi:Periplasmic copper-binding protein (NosD)